MRRAGVAPWPLTTGIPPPATARLAIGHFHCAAGFRLDPLTRACVRLLGPCFKTGRVGFEEAADLCNDMTNSDPLALTSTFFNYALWTVRCSQCPRQSDQASQVRVIPRPRETNSRGRYKTYSLFKKKLPSPQRLHSNPEPVAASFQGRKLNRRGYPYLGYPRRHEPARVCTEPTRLPTVSRPVELSLQSSFQLSFAVLVNYRSRACI